MPSHVTTHASLPSQVHASPGLHVLDVVGPVGPASLAGEGVVEDDEEEHAASTTSAVTAAITTGDFMPAS